MTRPRRLAGLWLAGLFLLLGTRVGHPATEVGGSGGYRTTNHRYSITSCGSTTVTTVHSGSQRYQGEVQADLPGEMMSLGVRAGLVVTDEVRTSSTGGGPAGVDVSRVYRVHIVPRLGASLRWFEGIGGVGISFGSSDEVLPSLTYEVRAGPIGQVAYYGRGEFLSASIVDMSLVHGVAILGGDRPWVHVAVGLQNTFHEILVSYEIGFSAPRHWRIRPEIRASVGPYSDPELTSFAVEGGLTVVLGERRRWSERYGSKRDRRGPTFEELFGGEPP